MHPPLVETGGSAQDATSEHTTAGPGPRAGREDGSAAAGDLAGVDAQAGGGRREAYSPGVALDRALRRQQAARAEHVLHPRRDRLWVSRTGAGDALTRWCDVRGGGRPHRWRLSERAWQDVGAVLGVPAALLERLGTLPKDEDCRLLNTLLWARGDDPDAELQWQVTGEVVTAVGTTDFRSLDLRELAEGLVDPRRTAGADVVRWDLHERGAWIVLGYPQAPALSVSPGRPGSAAGATPEADSWKPGVLLYNVEDGRQGAAVVPGLIRHWGRLWMPLGLATRARRRHGGGGSLARELVADVRAGGRSDWTAGLARLQALSSARGTEDVAGLVERLGPPWTAALRAQVRAVTGTRPTTRYRVMTAALRVAYTVEDWTRRLALLRALDLSVGAWLSPELPGASGHPATPPTAP